MTLTVPAHQAPPVYYVALGDSAAAGYASPTGQGYAGDILTHLQATVPDLQLVDLGCSGETSTSMIQGGSGGSYESGSLTSQLAVATSFLAAHRGSVALITIDIGGNDYISCLDPSPPSYNPQCITATDGTVTTNLTTIMAQIRAAAGPTVPIVGMNYFDPFLDYRPLGTLGQSVAKDSVPAVAGVNATLGACTAAIPTGGRRGLGLRDHRFRPQGEDPRGSGAGGRGQLLLLARLHLRQGPGRLRHRYRRRRLGRDRRRLREGAAVDLTAGTGFTTGPASASGIEPIAGTMASGGDAVARDPDGKAVFVRGALPGERVRVTLVADHARYAVGTVDEVLEPSPDRITAPCPEVARGCGACQWQHIAPRPSAA